MIKIERTEVFGWEAAIRGMRNPMNSWDKSDSHFKCSDFECCEGCPNTDKRIIEPCGSSCNSLPCLICKNDLKLMKSLSKAGTDHSKFLRMMNVTLDITAPLYWWKEYDTYKVGTVANSCSTMHKIHSKKFTLDDFSWEHIDGIWKPICEDIVKYLNYARDEYLKTKDKRFWWQMIQLLPTSYNQKRTVQLNYQVLKNMYFARKAHKLDEWREFCKWCETLPYFKEICIQE